MSANTYTFLFTDIQGSTRLWEQQPEAMRAALVRHDLVLRQAIEGQGGRVFRTAGDAFFASFPTAAGAVHAAVDAQEKLQAEAWELEGPLLVRMAIHTGEAEEQDGDYVGASLNRIGRLIAVCHGGQILLTQAAYELVRDALPPGASLLDLGRHRFRDLVHPEEIYQVSSPNLSSSFPPLKSLESTPNNLPNQLTRFIGREREMAKGEELLASSRLLTLTGPGGTGKTRLAIQLAASQLDAFPDGAWLVELAALADPRQLVESVAGVLGMRAHPPQPLLDSVREGLRSQQLLLVLDNCEHLVEACAELCEAILLAAPDVKILVTSREVLGVPGESILRVPPLAVPDASEGDTFSAVSRSDAAQLFVERAQAVQASFQLTPANAAAVAQITQRLDGIPLAIELAAARTSLLQPEQIAARLDDQFRLLSGGRRTALPRQQTLAAMIDWSHALLSESERVIFRRLALFRGGWSLEAAEEVCASRLLPPVGEDVLELMAQLVNKSLVQVGEHGGEARYRLLETMRQYALHKLIEADEMPRTRQAHLGYFLELARQAKTGLSGPSLDQAAWMSLLEREHDNLRAALEWGLEADLSASLELGSSLVYFWTARGYGAEGMRWLQAALDRLPDPPEALDSPSLARAAAHALGALGQLAVTQGDNAAARAALERSVHIFRQLDLERESLLYLVLLSLAVLFQGDIEHSHALAEKGEALGRELGDPVGLALALNIQAQTSLRMAAGYDVTRARMEESASLLRDYGNRWFSGLALMGLGVVAYVAQDWPTAKAHFRDSQRLFDEAGDLHFKNVIQSYLADIARHSGEYDRARELYQAVLRSWIRQGHQGGTARCLECLALILLLENAPEFTESLEQVEQAGCLLGAAENIRRLSRAGMTLDEQLEFYPLHARLTGQVEQDAAAQARFQEGLRAGRTVSPGAELDALVGQVL